MNPGWFQRCFRVAGLSAAVLVGCASQPDRVEAPRKEPDVVEAAPPPAAPSFENQGGMWMPGQMTAHAEVLRDLGLAYDPELLTDPTAPPLAAVVSLGGCSASFVSEHGLLITNHHCVTRALQANATPEQNLLEQGFLARDRQDERWAGPTGRVYVSTAFTDVTDEILRGIETIEDPSKRYETIESRRKALTAACEKKPDTTCKVASYFEGAQYFQIEQLEIRDVRLVYAPHAGVGVFGGDIDNWRWPRHTGDYAFLRAYVGKDGRPADYAADNIPFTPPHHLKVASDGLAPGDLVMVAGYPGRTYRLKTADEVQEAIEFTYPYRVAMFEDYIAVLEGIAKTDPDARIKVASRLRGLHNYLINYRGMLEGLVKGGLASQKQQLESDLRQWIAADTKRQATYGGVLEEMSRIHAAAAGSRQRDAAVAELIRASEVIGAALIIAKMAQERAKDDHARDAGYQQRDWPRLEQKLAAMDQHYSPKADRALLALALTRIAELSPENRPTDAVRAVLGTDEVTADTVASALDRLYAKTTLAKREQRLALLKAASVSSLRRSKDPAIRIAVALLPIEEAMDAREERMEGELAAVRPKYVAAVRAFTDGPLAPDANGTLRITFGTVRGYRSSPDATPFQPFTTVSEMVKKNTGVEPFAAPPKVLAAASTAASSPYADAALGDLPVDFLADLDITGGNSGSATLNARGELVGLVFDGNYESIASDWLFMPEVTRSIHVDIRYVLWLMDAVDEADHLLVEMGIEPSMASG